MRIKRPPKPLDQIRYKINFGDFCGGNDENEILDLILQGPSWQVAAIPESESEFFFTFWGVLKRA